MSKYNAIREQLRVEVDKRYQGNVSTLLRDIESKQLQDEFCDQYARLLNMGFHPYDCLIAYMKSKR